MTNLSLITYFRSLTRQRLYAGLNIGGLAVGIAVFLVLGLYVRFETSYESWLPGAQNIWLLEGHTADEAETQRDPQNTPTAAWTAIKRDLPGTIGTRLDSNTATVIKDGVGVLQELALVDPDFFRVFQLPVVAGSVEGALNDPAAIILTQHSAAKFFGTASPIGQTLDVTYGGVRHAYHVAAVVANLPANTELDFDMIARLRITEDRNNPDYPGQHYWNYGGPQTYIRTTGEADARRLSAQLPGVSERHVASETPDNNDYRMSLDLRRLTDVHLATPGLKLTVATLGIVGLLTLLLAIVNYVNLASARAGLRAREVAMRKVLGATRGAIIRHYMLEALVTAAIAAFLGLALAEAGLPLVNAAGGLQLAIHYFGSDGILLPMLLLVVVVAACSGAYPAFLLSRFPAAAVLASARTPGGGRAGTRLREILVIFQFSVAIAFMIGTMVLVAQTMHVREADVGFNRNQMVLVRSLASDSLNQAQRASILHRLAALPGVQSVSSGSAVPGGGLFMSSSNVSIPGEPGDGPQLQYFDVAPGYFRTVGAHLIAGRLFSLAHAGDLDPNQLQATRTVNGPLGANVVLNESAVRALHFASPQAAIGKTVGGKSPRTIIGVVQDMRFGSARRPVPATLYFFVEHDPQAGIGIIRFTGDAKVMLAAVRKVWLEEAPEVPFFARTAVQALDRYYARDDHMANLFTIGAVLAVLIGCVGLWGLASFNTARRVKEIGIRKTLGASARDIVKLLVGQFLRPVLLANLVAWPLAWAAMRVWLSGFSDRIALSPLFFVAASILATLIAVLTVLGQSLRASRAAPAWALRHE